MELKTCNACSEKKTLSNFYTDERKSFGKVDWCKNCIINSGIDRSRSKHGLTAYIYSSQRNNSIKRGHPHPEYSIDELHDWLLGQELFHRLYNEWVNSDYNSRKKPSIDRLDDYKGYSFDNIQLMTWDENRTKSYQDKKDGKNNKRNRSVNQYSLEGVFIEKFHSLSEAERVTGVQRPNINHCCLGRRKWAGGFIWKFTD